jgi:hypothetical protein
MELGESQCNDQVHDLAELEQSPSTQMKLNFMTFGDHQRIMSNPQNEVDVASRLASFRPEIMASSSRMFRLHENMPLMAPAGDLIVPLCNRNFWRSALVEYISAC